MFTEMGAADRDAGIHEPGTGGAFRTEHRHANGRLLARDVLLYELLTGALPFSARELRRAGFDEIRRQIREVDPLRPSMRLSTLGEKSTASAKKRRTEADDPDAPDPGRPGLDHHEGSRKGPRPALRLPVRPGDGHRPLPDRPTGPGRSTQRLSTACGNLPDGTVSESQPLSPRWSGLVIFTGTVTDAGQSGSPWSGTGPTARPRSPSEPRSSWSACSRFRPRAESRGNRVTAIELLEEGQQGDRTRSGPSARGPRASDGHRGTGVRPAGPRALRTEGEPRCRMNRHAAGKTGR